MEGGLVPAGDPDAAEGMTRRDEVVTAIRASVDRLRNAYATAPERDDYEAALDGAVHDLGTLVRASWLRVVGARSIEVAQRDEFGESIPGAVARYHLESVRVMRGHHLRHPKQELLTRQPYRSSHLQLVDVPEGEGAPRKVRRLRHPGYGFIPEGGDRVGDVPAHERIGVAAELLDVIGQMERMAARHRGDPLAGQIEDARRSLGG